MCNPRIGRWHIVDPLSDPSVFCNIVIMYNLLRFGSDHCVANFRQNNKQQIFTKNRSIGTAA